MVINSPAYLMLKHSKIKSDLEYKSLLIAIKTFNYPTKNDTDMSFNDSNELERVEPLRSQDRFGRKARIMSGLSATVRRAETLELEKELVNTRVNTHGKRPRYY